MGLDWIRISTKYRSDPKVRRAGWLAGSLYVDLLCMLADHRWWESGTIPADYADPMYLASTLGVADGPEQIEEALAALDLAGLIKLAADGAITVPAVLKDQWRLPTSAERMKRKRARDAQPTPPATPVFPQLQEGVTSLVTPSDACDDTSTSTSTSTTKKELTNVRARDDSTKCLKVLTVVLPLFNELLGRNKYALMANKITQDRVKLVQKIVKQANGDHDLASKWMCRVVVHFHELWHEDEKMARFITPETLFNGKFFARLEEANDAMGKDLYPEPILDSRITKGEAS